MCVSQFGRTCNTYNFHSVNSVKKKIHQKEAHSIHDEVKQFHSFTDTKPIQMLTQRGKKHTFYYRREKKNQN